MLVKVEDSKYLDYSKLDYKNEKESIAYLIDAKIGNSEKVGTFFTFYLRDVNGFTIVGRMFDVSHFSKQGYVLSAFKRKPVILKHTSQVFNGSPSLIITSIDFYKGEFEYDKFLGAINTSQEDLDYCQQTLERVVGDSSLTFPSSWITDSYIDVCSGRSGGVAKLGATVLRSLSNFENTPGVDFKELVICTWATLTAYAKYLHIVSVMDVPMKNQLLDIIYTTVANLDVRLKNISVDCCSAVMEFGEPQHLYSHLISKTLEDSKELLNFSFEFPLVVEGSTKKVGDKLLSRY